MVEYFKVALAQTKQRRAVHLGVTTNPIARAWMQRLAIFVLPHFGGVVAILQEHLRGAPIFFFTWKKCSALQNKNFFPSLG